jgi:hypothetical protein
MQGLTSADMMSHVSVLPTVEIQWNAELFEEYSVSQDLLQLQTVLLQFYAVLCTEGHNRQDL